MGIVSVVALSLLLVAGNALAQAQDEVRMMFDRYVQAENEHNLASVGQALQDSKDMLWMAPRGAPVWGRDAVMQELTKLYQGPWKLEPDLSAIKVTAYGESFARVVVPIRYTVSATAAPERYLVQQTYIKTAIGWRITSMVQLLAPAQ